MKSEFDLINALKRKIPRALQGTIPIGDDCGAVSLDGKKAVLLTTDAIVEGVDFIRNKIKPEMAGRKALAVNLSDVAAMAAEPAAFLVTLGIPANMQESWILKFYEGMIKLAGEYKVVCAGGDITKAKEFFASIALIGQAEPDQVIRREGARYGDWIAVSGELGGSLLEHHYLFTPRIKEARFLTQLYRPTSMIDISDGLLQDLEHLLKASGVSAELDLDKIPVSQDAVQLSKKSKRPAIEHALTDGEDFELLFTVPSEIKASLEKAWKQNFSKTRLSWIGRIRSGKGPATIREKGKTVYLKLRRKGYSHF